MALDIVGPASAPNAVTSRPGDTRTFGATDTWFKDCTSPVANDGTKLQAGFMNSVAALIRQVIRGNGLTAGSAQIVVDDNADDNMMLKAVQHLIQRGQTKYAADSGTADALVAALSPAPPEYKTGTVWYVKKGANANATTTPTVNFNALGTKTIVDRRGATLAIGDLPANAELVLLYDGTNMRNLGVVSADMAAIGTLRNVKQFNTSGRVSMSGNSGNSYTVTAWSPGSYVKQSSTSVLLIWCTFPTLTNGATGSGQGTLSIGATDLVFVPTNNTVSLSYGEGTLVQALTGFAAGSYSLAVKFSRTDSTAWTGVFCFNGTTDGGGYPSATTATIVMAEVGL